MSGYGRVILEDAAVEGERVSLRPISKQDARACFDLVHGSTRSHIGRSGTALRVSKRWRSITQSGL